MVQRPPLETENTFCPYVWGSGCSRPSSSMKGKVHRCTHRIVIFKIYDTEKYRAKVCKDIHKKHKCFCGAKK